MNASIELPRVSIVILNFNGREFIGECLESLQELNYPKICYEIMVVDNASTDGSADYIAEMFPKVKIIRNAQNFGFARGNNIGIKECNPASKYIALANLDSTVNNDWLKELVASMEDNQRAGCCGAREESCNSAIVIKRKEFKGNWTGGGSVIYRKTALDEVGLFDELYFAYCEDIDLSWRLKLKGWEIICNHNAVWFHYGTGRSININDRRLFLASRNRIYLLLKFGSKKQILRSLFKYVINFVFGKNKKQKETSGNLFSVKSAPGPSIFIRLIRILSKIMLFIRIILDVVFKLPVLLIKRNQLKKNTTVSGSQIDEWIVQIDEELLQGVYNY